MISRNKSITERKRIASWWIKLEDLSWPSHDGYDRIKYRAEAMARASVTTAMIFGAHFRWDFLPYFTILHDYMATVAEELKKYGVELWDHHSVCLAHRYSTREEMHSVMLHSGPHLPFSPSREAAESWEYKGKRLNDWRMLDVKTRDVLYLPQYTAEAFCYRNPDFVESYIDYATNLVRETGISGLSADDPIHFMQYNSCACPHCREALRKRSGIELPDATDLSFWGNFDNPAWIDWIDLRFEAAGDFFRRLSEALPTGFRLTTCGINSASPIADAAGSDASTVLKGCNYINLEMSGNTPPYKKDSATVNCDIATRLVTSSHHQGTARGADVRCFSTGFGFTEVAANTVWAVTKMLDSDCWFSTLKDRLGLPEHILKSLPDEHDVAGRAFGYEKDHPELFDGASIGQLAVYYSEETRTHTFFGACERGYYSDYHKTLELLFDAGISPHTVFDFPEKPDKYPLVLMPSPVKLTDSELKALDGYIKARGRVIVYGPTCISGHAVIYELQNSPSLPSAEEFFSSVRDGINHRSARWMTDTEFLPTSDACDFNEIRNGLYFCPRRITSGGISDALLALTRRFMKPLPIETVDTEGYLVTLFEKEDAYTVRLLAKEFDTGIDEELDRQRFHRSRVNYVNRAEPIGVKNEIRVASSIIPEAYTPFNSGRPLITTDGKTHTVSLPEKAPFIILYFKKQNKARA